MATINGEFFSTTDAAKYLGFAEDTVRRYINAGLITGVKVGHQWLVPKEECDRYSREKRGPGNPSFVSKKK